MFMSQIGPTDAAANLGKWLEWIGLSAPPWLLAPRADQVAFWAGAITLLAWLLWFFRESLEPFAVGAARWGAQQAGYVNGRWTWRLRPPWELINQANNQPIALSVDATFGGYSPAQEDGRPAKYVQIIVTAGVELNDCEVVITSIDRVLEDSEQPIYREPLHCTWSWGKPGQTKQSIPRGTHKNANLCRVLNGEAYDHFGLLTYERPAYLAEQMQMRGKYRLKVHARAAQIEPTAPAFFLLTWDGYGHVSLAKEPA